MEEMKNLFQSNQVLSCQNEMKLSYVSFYLTYHRGKLTDDKGFVFLLLMRRIWKLRNLAHKCVMYFKESQENCTCFK